MAHYRPKVLSGQLLLKLLIRAFLIFYLVEAHEGFLLIFVGYAAKWPCINAQCYCHLFHQRRYLVDWLQVFLHRPIVMASLLQSGVMHGIRTFA
jgi:hypothetical protein